MTNASPNRRNFTQHLAPVIVHMEKNHTNDDNPPSCDYKEGSGEGTSWSHAGYNEPMWLLTDDQMKDLQEGGISAVDYHSATKVNLEAVPEVLAALITLVGMCLMNGKAPTIDESCWSDAKKAVEKATTFPYMEMNAWM